MEFRNLAIATNHYEIVLQQSLGISTQKLTLFNDSYVMIPQYAEALTTKFHPATVQPLLRIAEAFLTTYATHLVTNAPKPWSDDNESQVYHH